MDASKYPGWYRGPLPAGTYNWGAVVLASNPPGTCYMADFAGDHAKVQCTDLPGKVVSGGTIRVEANEILAYTNAIPLPPKDLTILPQGQPG